MKYTDPVVDAKLKSKTHLPNRVFKFFEPFYARLASKFEKVLIWPRKIFFAKNQKCIKTPEFHIHRKSFKKMNTKKVISQTNIMNMSKSELLLMFIKFVLLIIFFRCLKSAWNSAFFNTFLVSPLSKFFWSHILFF